MAEKSKMGWMAVAVVILALGLVGVAFQAGTPAPAGTEAPSIQCNKDYSKAIALVDKNFYEKGTDAGNVTYKVWTLQNGNQVPSSDVANGGSLTLSYGEKYQVVATLANATNEKKELAIDDNCNAPADTAFYIKLVPEAISAVVENSDITGQNSFSNKIPLVIDDSTDLDITFKGASKTEAPALLVLDYNKDVMSKVESSTATSSNVPNSHTAASASQQSKAFEIGTLKQSSKLLHNFDFTAEDGISAQHLNVTGTIYRYQNGYVNTVTGDFDNKLAIEDDDDAVLLPVDTFTIFFDVTA